MALACAGSEIPVSSVEILGLGGPIPVAGFAVPGTPELAEKTIQAFHDRPKLKAVLLQNHGSLTIGPDLDGAFRNAVKLERGAQAHLLSLASGSSPVLISQEEVALVREKYMGRDGATPPTADVTRGADLPAAQ
jgi:ribulose-5-phosphate 4-epimerase/fuculose-1-phosphate aldolase